MPRGEVERSLFDRIGGFVAVDRLVEGFCARLDSLPQAQTIRAMHAADLAPTKAVLRRYLTEWLGGPKLYSRDRSDRGLRARHHGLAIGVAERDAWIACMSGALSEAVEDLAARAEVHVSLARLADWLRNQPAAPPARPRGR